MSNFDRDVKILWSFQVKCPRCNSTFMVSDCIYDIPIIGKILISRGKCESCGYKYSNYRAIESQGPQKLVFNVETPDDLNVLVVRTASATIRIPELGIEIKPGPAAQGYITTIEGVLDKVLEVLSLVKDDPEVDKLEREKREKEIIEARNGKRRFTFILEDPDGVSRIISDKVKKDKLYSSHIT